MNDIVAFIPVRGGSKSIPQKNIRSIAGHPLVYWTVKAACECELIEKVYVSTDSRQIADTVKEFGFSKVEVIGRSEDSASDTAPTEFAMLEFAAKYDFETIVLIQATSPLLRAEDISGGLQRYADNGVDSVLSVVRQKRFVWKEKETGLVKPVNYDVNLRPRRQEFAGFLVENGAYYITSKDALIKTGNRLSANIGYYIMPEETYNELDEPEDWVVIERFLSLRNAGPIVEVKLPDFSKIKMFLTDCDGCLTDGGMYYSENGDEMKKFSTRDGQAFQMLRKRGIITGIITSEDREINSRRAQKLHLDELHQGVQDKERVIRSLCEKYGYTLDEVLYIGDDLNDLAAIRLAGLGCCPSDAVDEVKKAADYVSRSQGGYGVIRELADMMRLAGEDVL